MCVFNQCAWALVFRSMDSAYNEHLVQIGQLQEEVVRLRRQLAQKHVELLAKEKEVACLKSDLAEFEALHRQRELAREQMQREEVQRLKVPPPSLPFLSVLLRKKSLAGYLEIGIYSLSCDSTPGYGWVLAVVLFLAWISATLEAVGARNY